MFPDIPAEMPGITLKRHHKADRTFQNNIDTLIPSTEQDWSKLADEAIMNADLETSDHLPPPPELIEIDNDDYDRYVPPVNTLPLTKTELSSD